MPSGIFHHWAYCIMGLLKLNKARINKKLVVPPQWLPTRLFATGESGAWYDPSDLSTLFQDSAGTTPVTTLGQPVGLVLDKSRGGLTALGPELITNGDFSSGATGWAAEGTNSIAVVGGELEVTLNNASFNGATSLYSTPLTVGRMYRVTVTARRGTTSNGFTVRFGTGVGEGDILFVGTTNTTVTRFFTATAATTGMRVVTISSGGQMGTLYVDNISIREVPGNHLIQTTTASRPTVQARVNLLTRTEEFNDAMWLVWSGGVKGAANVGMSPNGTATADAISLGASIDAQVFQNCTLRVGTYTLSFYVRRNTTTDQTFRLKGTVGTGAASLSPNFTATDVWQRISHTFTVVSPHNGNVSVNANVGGTSADLLVWGAQLELGSIATTYQRVTTATDYQDIGLPRYLQFDGIDDSLVSATALPLTAATATIVCGFRKGDMNTFECVYETSIAFTSNGAFTLFAPGGADPTGVEAFMQGNASIRATGIALGSTNVIAVQYDRIAGSQLRINSTQVYQDTVNIGTPFKSHVLYVGRRAGTSSPFSGRLHSLIIRGTLSDADTIVRAERWVASKTGVVLPQ